MHHRLGRSCIGSGCAISQVDGRNCGVDWAEIGAKSMCALGWAGDGSNYAIDRKGSSYTREEVVEPMKDCANKHIKENQI